MWIDFEGIDGSGKTELSVRFARRLRSFGLRAHHPREAGTFRSRVTAGIRALTRDPESLVLAPETELLLNAAREAQLLAEEIRPALAGGDVVVTDRALYAHIAMAEAVRGLAPGRSDAVAEFASGGRWPDAVVLVDVDPEVARLRKRLRKIREFRYGASSRKGLYGEALAPRLREALLLAARGDPARWHVLDNSWRTADEAEAEVFALLSPKLDLPSLPRTPAPPPPRVPPGETMADWTIHFLRFVQDLAERSPALAALHVAGLDDPRADAVRAAAVESEPEVAAYSVAGLESRGAWAVRRRARRKAPAHVARSLRGLGEHLAWSWREDLRRDTPDQVLHSLVGMGQPEAYELRRALWEASRDEGLRSLALLDDAAAWELRTGERRRVPTGALAESVIGLDDPRAWTWRDELRSPYPLSVLRSVEGLDDERAWRMREEFAPFAPRVVLETMRGLDGPCGEALRDALEERCPDEVAGSLAGMDTPEAWRRRRAMADAGPGGVLDSLAGLAGHPDAVELVRRILAAGGGRPRLVRKAVRLHLQNGARPGARGGVGHAPAA